MHGPDHPPLKVALVCIGIGLTRRGYERYFCDLYERVQGDLDVTLFGSAPGEGPPRQVPARLRQVRWFTRLLPLGLLANEAEDRHYRHDCLAYSLALMPELLRGRYDVVHVIDYYLARAMRHMVRMFMPQARLVYSNGCCVPAGLCPRVDLVHYVAEPLYKEATARGGSSRPSMVPCGIDPRQFRSPLSRRQLRHKHGVGENTRLVLAVTAVKRPHKRADHLISELSRVQGDVMLWIDGRPDDPSLIEHARSLLGHRFRCTHVPSDQVGELYNMADVFVHAALEESFGLAIVEAMSCGLPVLVHDAPHFQWLTGGRESLVEMNKPGALAERLQQWMAGSRPLAPVPEERWRRFDWQVLKEQYLALYRSLSAERSGRTAPDQQREEAHV